MFRTKSADAIPRIVRWGRWLMTAVISAMVIGGALVRLLFPDRVGKGLDAFAISILVPLWSLGVLAIVLLLVGWLRYPDFDAYSALSAGARKSESLLGPTWWLIRVTIVLVWMISVFPICTLDEQQAPTWLKVTISCLSTTCCAFIFFLTTSYCAQRHRAVASYMALLVPPLGRAPDPVDLAVARGTAVVP